MISNKQGQVHPPASRSAMGKRTDLSEYDGQRLAVVMQRDGGRIVLRGKASFVGDELLGNVLNIHLDNAEPGSPVVVIAEDQWDGRIIPDFHFGCKYCLMLK